VVDDGYRDPAHNARVGGKPESQHLYLGGNSAADFRPVGAGLQTVFDWIRLDRATFSRPDSGWASHHSGDDRHIGKAPFPWQISQVTLSSGYRQQQQSSPQSWLVTPSPPQFWQSSHVMLEPQRPH
jgi:hypothetical protein